MPDLRTPPAQQPADETCMLKVGDSDTHFRCECGCNVFRRVLLMANTFACNACGAWYAEH